MSNEDAAQNTQGPKTAVAPESPDQVSADQSATQSKLNIKRLKRVSWVICLGAIGSGVWSGVGGPLLSLMASFFIRVMSFFSSSYIDYLHKNIGKGLREEITVYLFLLTNLFFFTFFISSGIIAPIRFYLRARRKSSGKPAMEKKGGRQSKPQISQTILLTWAAISLAMILLLILSFIQIVYTNSAIVQIERSIDILSPYISEQERLMLRSQYRAIDNANKFYEMESKLKAISEEKNIPIPEFKFME